MEFGGRTFGAACNRQHLWLVQPRRAVATHSLAVLSYPRKDHDEFLNR
jgi:hypothetical protein